MKTPNASVTPPCVQAALVGSECSTSGRLSPEIPLKNRLRESVPPWLIYCEKSGNACDDDTQLWWSEPGIAVEPVLPTPAVMRTDGTRWARRRRHLCLSLDQGKDLDILPTPVGHPGAAKRSTCHIDPAHRPEQDWLALHHCRRGQETADGTDATSASAFGSWSKTLLTQNTWQTIRLVG
jgi:hypothetical protein